MNYFSGAEFLVWLIMLKLEPFRNSNTKMAMIKTRMSIFDGC